MSAAGPRDATTPVHSQGSIRRLPNELLLIIAENLEEVSDIFHFALADSALWNLLQRWLFQRDFDLLIEMRGRYLPRPYALHWACRYGILSTVKRALVAYPRDSFALSLGSNYSFSSCWGCTPIQMAAYLGHTDVAKMLLDHGVWLAEDDPEPFTIALENHCVDIAQLMLSMTDNPLSDFQDSVVLLLSREENLPVVRVYLERLLNHPKEFIDRPGRALHEELYLLFELALTAPESVALFEDEESSIVPPPSLGILSHIIDTAIAGHVWPRLRRLPLLHVALLAQLPAAVVMLLERGVEVNLRFKYREDSSQWYKSNPWPFSNEWPFRKGHGPIHARYTGQTALEIAVNLGDRVSAMQILQAGAVYGVLPKAQMKTLKWWCQDYLGETLHRQPLWEWRKGPVEDEMIACGETLDGYSGFNEDADLDENAGLDDDGSAI